MRTTRLLLSLLLALVMAHAAAPAWGAAEVTTDHATVTLLAEAPPAPGGTLWLGLHFRLAAHWHVYWKNPGASGTAPVIRWDLPAGWQAGDIRWPVPQRIRVGPLTNYGYEDEVLFMVPVTVPAGYTPGAGASIGAEAQWLVCREECIPESGSFVLPLGAAGSDPTPFAEARERWPAPGTLAGRYQPGPGSIAVALDLPATPSGTPEDIWLAADAWGPVDASGTQSWALEGARLTLQVPAGDLPPAGDGPLAGLVVLEHAPGAAPAREGWQVRLAPAPAAPAQGPAPLGLVTAPLFAFAGGLVLNVMPCVLPVLGIKVLGFVHEAGSARGRLAVHGLAYAAGILVSFALLAAGLLALRAGGEALGWGFQLQSPLAVTLLAYLMLAVGLSLSGVFSLGGGLMGAGQALSGGRGLANTFGTGVLAAVVASPCTAPFMGAALGFALTRPAPEALGVFMALGVGFALPVLALSLWPAWVRLIPRPGPWMGRFQQLLAFPMYATAAWLLWVLGQQSDPRGYGGALAGLVAVALAAWVYGQWRPRGWRAGALGAGLAGALVLALGPVTEPGPAPGQAAPSQDAWSEARVRELTAAGRPVFVNFTAAWCITCKVNEQLALATPATRRRFAERDVAYLVADWTRHDPVITRQLEHYGRSGVPLYLLYSPAADAPMVLPQLLTEGIVAEAIHTL